MRISKFFVIILFLSTFSCFDDNNADIELTINNSDWSAIINEYGFGEVHLNITGSTNADNVTVETYGDGEITDYTINLDSDKNFNDDVIISFTHAPDTNTAINSSTVVTAYKDNDTKKITLESPVMHYILWDCGDCN